MAGRHDIIDPKRSRHPSYGVASLSRVSGLQPLVGSTTAVNATAIRLTFHRGERTDSFDGGDYWLNDGLPLLEVTLSMTQWAELITTPDTATRIPCTLVQIDGERMPPPPEHDGAIDRVLQESRAELLDGPDPSDAARDELRKLRAEIDALKVSKSVKQALRERVETASAALRGPGIVAHHAVERIGRHLATAAAQARIDVRAGVVPLDGAAAAIEGSVAGALPAVEGEDA